MSLPWTDDGIRILPSRVYLEWAEKMRDFRSQYEKAVDDFLAKYDDYVAEARRRLNGMFNAADYPPQDVVRKRFKFKLDFTPLPSGADFRVDVPAAELAELRANVDQAVAEARATATRDVWKRLIEPVAAMAERLRDPENVFRDTLVTNMREILRLAPALNLGEDPQLDALCNRMRNELACHSPDRLRHNLTVRNQTAQAAADILKQMNDYLGEPSPAPVPTTPNNELAMVLPPGTAPAFSFDVQLAAA
jgi:hypothetical protein